MAEVDDDFGDEFNNDAQKQMALDKQRLEKEFESKGWPIYSRKPFNYDKFKPIRFMQIECDYYTIQNESIIRMFGVTEQGNSLLVHVRGFLSYLYIPAPSELNLKNESIAQFMEALNKLFAQQKQFKSVQPIVKIELVYKESIRYYKGDNKKCAVLKVYTQEPQYVVMIRNFLKSENRQVEDINLPSLTFESNVPYALRFMIDYDIVGMGWVEFSNYKEQPGQMSHCQREFTVHCKDVKAISLETESMIAPLRILSFDIECAAQRGFPNENIDPVIQIACIVKEHNQLEEIVKVVFTLDDCESIPGARVMSFQNEEDLLLQFQVFMLALDPDFIIGYNIQNFDLPYIINRARVLKLKDYGQFGRIINNKSIVKDGKFLSKAMGMRDTKDVSILGRIQLDLMMHIMRDHKLSSYTLNNVSFSFLKQQKEDVHHSIIYSLQQKNPETRKRIAVYCLKDAQLPINLMDKLFCIYNYSEMARVTGVPINYLFSRGQSIKVASQLYRKAKHLDFIIPVETYKNSGDQYEGAHVIEPKRAFYKIPIATLDFASLYPSIMMAHNMCYTTLLTDKVIVDEDNITHVPDSSIKFVKSNVRKGILPMILEDLINARKKAKVQLAQEQDPFKKAVLDGRQLALKISANSVYGFTGAQIGQLPCLEISASITSFGRIMIQNTEKMVEEIYCKANGYSHDAVVVYGDTDSVMVKFGVDTVEEAMRLGKEAADKISATFLKPIKLEFEKVYYPYLLMNRKRYAGLLWTKKDKYDKIDTKGIESVRRDNCFLIRKMVTQIMDYLLIQRNEMLAVEYVKDEISKLYQNKIDISELVITKSLNEKKPPKDDGKKKKPNDENKSKNITETYKSKAAHVAVAEKMGQRDGANAPASGDRIAYIIIQGIKGSKTYQNAEDPVEVLIKGFPVDFDYYLHNQIKKPLERIFENVLPNCQSLFIGEHTRARYIPKVNTNSGLGKYIVKKLTCMGCKSELKTDDALCFSCKNTKTLEIMNRAIYDLQGQQLQYHKLWSTCQSCQGSMHEQVICSNRDCEIYYKRIKVRTELETKWADYDKLQTVDW